MREGIDRSSLYRQIFDSRNTDGERSDMSIVCYSYMDKLKKYYRKRSKILPICKSPKNLTYTFIKNK